MKFEFSAGGIVLRKRDKRTDILVAQHSQHHGWVFPKGLIGDKVQSAKLKVLPAGKAGESSTKRETKEEAAVREVQEETGIDAKIVAELSPVTYWYQFGGEKIKKTVYYFLMEYVSGDTKDRDFEMENVEWLPVDNVEERLTYKSDKQVWQVALKAKK